MAYRLIEWQNYGIVANFSKWTSNKITLYKLGSWPKKEFTIHYKLESLIESSESVYYVDNYDYYFKDNLFKLKIYFTINDGTIISDDDLKDYKLRFSKDLFSVTDKSSNWDINVNWNTNVIRLENEVSISLNYIGKSEDSSIVLATIGLPNESSKRLGFNNIISYRVKGIVRDEYYKNNNFEINRVIQYKLKDLSRVIKGNITEYNETINLIGPLGSSVKLPNLVRDVENNKSVTVNFNEILKVNSEEKSNTKISAITKSTSEGKRRKYISNYKLKNSWFYISGSSTPKPDEIQLVSPNNDYYFIQKSYGTDYSYSMTGGSYVSITGIEEENGNWIYWPTLKNLLLPLLSEDGYIYGKWSDNRGHEYNQGTTINYAGGIGSQGGDPYWRDNSSLTMYIDKTPKIYELSFEGAQISWHVFYNQEINIVPNGYSEDHRKLPPISSQGYNFKGWKYKKDNQPSDEYIKPTDLYQKMGSSVAVPDFEAIEYTISFKKVADDETNVPENINVRYDSKPDNLSSIPERYGYIFAGYHYNGVKYYNENGECIKEKYQVTENIELSPSWNPVKFNIKFSPGEGASGSETLQELEYGVEQKLRTVENIGFSKKYNEFVRWKTTVGEKVYEYKDGAEGTFNDLYIPGYTPTLTASWKQQSTIRYYKNKWCNIEEVYVYQDGEWKKVKKWYTYQNEWKEMAGLTIGGQ